MGQPESKLGGSQSDLSTSQTIPPSPKGAPSPAFPPASPSPASSYPGSPYAPSSPFPNSPYPASSVYPPSPYAPNSPFPTSYPISPSLSFTPQSPGPQGIPSIPIPVDGIPYTNYSVEKTPEKHDKSKRPSPPSQPTFVDDPLSDKFKRTPCFVPILSNKKLQFDDVDTKGMLSILSSLETYMTNQAEFTKREHEQVSDSMRQMQMACEKAASLAFQHASQIQKFAAQIPNVEQMTIQLTHTRATLNKVVTTLSLLETHLDAREHLLEASPSPSLSLPSSSSSSSLSLVSVLPTSTSSPSLSLLSASSSSSSLASSSSSLPDASEDPSRPPRPRPKKSTNESPYLTAKPRGAASRKPTIEGAPPASSPPVNPIEVWTCKIIPKWDELKVRESPWIRSMWKTGIPKSVRGQVWKLAIGNNLGITKEVFDSLLEESLDSPQQLDTRKAIEVDLSRTFAQIDVGDLTAFSGNLRRVLKAYSKYKSDVGYVQGMSYIAGMLLQYMDDYESFVCMSNLLENAFLKGLFRLDTEAIEQYVSIFGSLLNQIEPKLDQHFTEIGLIPQHYLLQWWFPIFSKSLPLEICGKIWDCFLLEGEIFAFVASLGILRLYKKSLKTMDMEECKKLLGNLPLDIPEEELFMAIESIPAPLYNSFLEKIHAKIT